MTKQKDLDLVEISHQKRIVLGQDSYSICNHIIRQEQNLILYR